MHTFKKQLTTSSLFAFALMVILVSTSSARAQDPGLTAFQNDQSVFLANPAVNMEVKFQIPLGKRLVIERLTAFISVPHNVGIKEISLGTHVNNVPGGHQLPKPDFQTTLLGDDYYVVYLTPNVYADGTGPISAVNLLVTLSVPSKAQLSATISGHLVCPVALNCAKAAATSSTGVTEGTSLPATVAEKAQTRPRFAKPSERETIAKASGQ